jgi:hypothetical protein
MGGSTILLSAFVSRQPFTTRTKKMTEPNIELVVADLPTVRLLCKRVFELLPIIYAPRQRAKCESLIRLVVGDCEDPEVIRAAIAQLSLDRKRFPRLIEECGGQEMAEVCIAATIAGAAAQIASLLEQLKRPGSVDWKRYSTDLVSGLKQSAVTAAGARAEANGSLVANSCSEMKLNIDAVLLSLL